MIDQKLSLSFKNEEFIDEDINLFNFKLHFLVLLKKKKRAGTKYFLIFKGIFLFQLQTLLYYYLISDLIFFLFFDNLFYQKIKKKLKLSILFPLIIFYIYNLLTYSISKFLNIQLFYNKTELLESRGNFLIFLTNSLYFFNKKIIRFRKNYNFFYNKLIIKYIINQNKKILKDDFEAPLLINFIELAEYKLLLKETYIF